MREEISEYSRLINILNYSVDTAPRYNVMGLSKSNIENIISFLKELEI